MSGWTGRYGIPLEFLISVQVSTLMPDLAYDIATSFDTEIVMLLDKFDNGSLYYGDTVDNQAASDETTQTPDEISHAEGGNTEGMEEEVAYDFIPKGPIDAAASEDPDVRASSGLDWDREFALAVLSAMNGAPSYGKYDTYLARVENHWFRDIYFVLNGNDRIVNPDTTYEHNLKERYTLYETYTEADGKPSKIGEYKLYELDKDGNYKKENGRYVLYNGTYDDAIKNGISVSKMAKTLGPSSALSKFGWNARRW